jgi:hypothetical protein
MEDGGSGSCSGRVERWWLVVRERGPGHDVWLSVEGSLVFGDQKLAGVLRLPFFFLGCRFSGTHIAVEGVC